MLTKSWTEAMTANITQEGDGKGDYQFLTFKLVLTLP